MSDTKNKDQFPNPVGVCRPGEPANTMGSWHRYKASLNKSGDKNPLKGYPYNEGKIKTFSEWTNFKKAK